MSTTADTVNATLATAAAVVSAGVGVLTYLDQRRSRQPTEPARAKPETSSAQAKPAPPKNQVTSVTRKAAPGVKPDLSGHATIAVVLGAWGISIITANRPGANGDHGDYVFGILLAVVASLFAVWALYKILVKPKGLRGLWLAIAGLATGVGGIVIALLAGW